MTDAASGGTAEFAGWIGRSLTRHDVLSPRLLREFEATLAPHLAQGRPVPPAIFWCLAPEALPASQLGEDAHPRKGLVLPDLGLPRRMWAGGELVFHGEFSPGDAVERVSTIEKIDFKSGSSGRLGFVTVRHHYRTGGRLVVDERQDIVYRDPPPPNAPASAPAAPRAEAAPLSVLRRWELKTDPTLLFRYSALTFNGHRIHYDYPYATGVEGYAGLVVHGPLQATLMLTIIAEELGRLPARFAYRGLSPLICGVPCAVEAVRDAAGKLGARVVAEGGRVTMAAQIEAE